jgi:hypothetical protein
MTAAVLGYDVGAKYGMGSPTGAVADTPLAHITKATPAQNNTRFYHPDHPLMAFGVLVGVTAGLLAFSGSVRVGKTTAKASIGKTGDS